MNVMPDEEKAVGERPPGKSILAGIGRVLLGLAALAPVVYSAIKQWPEIHTALVQADWSNLALSLALLLVMMPLMGLIPWLTLHYLGVRLSVSKVVGIYFVSQLVKYLPGGIWAYPGRMVAYERSGVGRVPAIMSVSREVVVLFLGSAALALAGIFFGVEMPVWMQVATIFGVLSCFVAAFLTLVPGVWRWLSRFAFFRKSALAVLGDAGTMFHLRWLPGTFAVSVLFWLGTGFAFLPLVRAVVPAVAMNWLQAGSIFALAWCVGFVIVFLPAGFGAREIVLSYLLSRYMGSADALTIALLARFWWMGAEAVYMALSPALLFERR